MIKTDQPNKAGLLIGGEKEMQEVAGGDREIVYPTSSPFPVPWRPPPCWEGPWTPTLRALEMVAQGASKMAVQGSHAWLTFLVEVQP